MSVQPLSMRGAIHARLIRRAHQIAARLQTRSEAAGDAVTTAVQSVGTVVEITLRTDRPLPEKTDALFDQHRQFDPPPIEEATR
ncbi:MAG: hypothetical protein AAGI12_10095 [Pseudomonadota bacterium]